MLPVPAAMMMALKPYYRHLMGAAERLLRQGDATAAAVTAFTACEVLTEQVFDELWRARQMPELFKPVAKALSSNNLAHERVRDVYNALSGDRIETQPFWPAFIAFMKLRNRLVHGQDRQVDRGEVAVGIKAAEQLQHHLIRRLYPYADPLPPSAEREGGESHS